MNSTDIILFSTIMSGIIGLLLRYAFKSKCDTVNLCCGFIQIHRDIDKENETNETDIEIGIIP